MSKWVAAFVQRLHDLGWIEGRSVLIEYRWAEGRRERLSEITAEFARLKVDVIVTAGAAVAAAKQTTSVRNSRLHVQQVSNKFAEEIVSGFSN